LLLSLLLAAVIDGHLRKLFLGLKPGPAGAIWVHHWCRRITQALGISIAIEGPTPRVDHHALALVSNHLSYLDILVFSAIRPFIMVAKSEVRHWPLIGWITAQAGTVYVQRADVKGGRTQTHTEVNAAMAHAFRFGLPVLFFPEGTTTDSSTVLPFRRGLFHSVLHDQVPVQTATIAYTLTQPNQDASVANDVCFWGEADFLPHLLNFLNLRGVHVNIRFNPHPIPGQDRFTLSQNAQAFIAATHADLAQTPTPIPATLGPAFSFSNAPAAESKAT
jgi:1-acyl-sn-glycerol-3-phosphate acyltransferase